MNTNTTAAEIAAARRAEEDAIWEAEGRKVAQRVIAEQVAAMEDHILDAFRNDLHRERRDLVNLYTGADRKTKIADLDLVIGAVEEEQAERAGLASSADILATFSNPDFVTVQDADHLATLLDVDEDEKAPERILWDTKILGAAVTLIAQNPRTAQGGLTEWDLTDGDETPYGTVFTNPYQDSALALHRRMAREARAYWRSH